jgi:hypothetical protein
MSTMSARGDGGQQQLHSKFVAGFICHIEKNEVETNADNFVFTWGVLGGVFPLPSHFLTFPSFPLASLITGGGAV